MKTIAKLFSLAALAASALTLAAAAGDAQAGKVLTPDLRVSATFDSITISKTGPLPVGGFTVRISSGFTTDDGPCVSHFVPASIIRIAGMVWPRSITLPIPVAATLRVVEVDVLDEIAETDERNNQALVPTNDLC